MINKSFSKGDMLDIIHRFNIDIPNCNTFDKLKLSITLWSYINNAKEIIADNEIYMINNKEELLEFLSNQNPDKILSVKEKKKIMTFCKEVVVYCNNGYNLDCSIFNSTEEIFIPMNDIAKHGDIPSVRRAIRLLNKDPKLKDNIKPILSNKMKREIEKKKNKKVKTYYGLISKQGCFTITFD